MKVVRISNEPHGEVAIALTVADAIDYLLRTAWIDNQTLIWDEKKHNWIEINESLGENWRDDISHFDIDRFNDVFDGTFELTLSTVYERELN